MGVLSPTIIPFGDRANSSRFPWTPRASTFCCAPWPPALHGSWRCRRLAATPRSAVPWPPYPGLGIPNHQNETVLVLKAMVLVFLGTMLWNPHIPGYQLYEQNYLMKFQNMHKPRWNMHRQAATQCYSAWNVPSPRQSWRKASCGMAFKRPKRRYHGMSTKDGD